MTTAELALTSAFGASLLTALASLGVTWFQDRRRRKADDQAALRGCAGELLSRSLAVAMRARAAGDTMKLRSGLKEDASVAMRLRKLVDPLELFDWMAVEISSMNAALSEIWTRDNQEGIRLANDVVQKSMALLDAATARQPAEGLERLRRWAAGEQWTPEMTKAYDNALRELALARKRYADHVRARFGLDAVELFASPEVDDKPKAIEEGASPPGLPASAEE